MKKDYDDQGYLDNTIVNDMFRNPYNTWAGEKIELLAREVLCRRNNQKWISVKDRLPKKSGDYLVIIKHPDHEPFMLVIHFVLMFNPHWPYLIYNPDMSILYWMPLPESPDNLD